MLMNKQAVEIDYEYYDSDQVTYDDLKEAANKLAVTTQNQFEEIKKEKWFNRVFDMITLSKNSDKRTPHARRTQPCMKI